MIDIKTDGPITYAAIDAALRHHPRLMTRFAAGRTHERAVTAVISGNRPLEMMQAQRVRFMTGVSATSTPDCRSP